MSKPKFLIGQTLWLVWARKWVKVTHCKRVGVKTRRWVYRVESLEDANTAYLGVREEKDLKATPHDK